MPCSLCGQQCDDAAGVRDLAESGQCVMHAVDVRVGVQVGHGVDGDGDVVAVFVGCTGGGFDARLVATPVRTTWVMP